MKLTQTAKEIVKDVAETQRKSFQAGRARVKQVAEVPTSHLVPEGVDAYRDIVQYNLKTQTKLGDQVLKRVTAVERFPSPMKEPATRLQDVAHELVDSNAKLVDGICDALIKAYPEQAMESMGKALGDPVCKVRDATQKVVSMEMEWIEKLLGTAKKAAESEPRPPPGKMKTPTKKKSPTKKKTVATKKKAAKRASKASA